MTSGPGPFAQSAVERQSGESADEIAHARAEWEEAFGIIAAERADAAAKSRLRRLYDDLPASARSELDRTGGVDTAIAQLVTPWFRTFLALDPRAYLARVRAPVLALFGERDVQVPPKANLPELRKALSTDTDVTIRELPGLNHLFQSATSGSPEEYGQITETVAPSALSVVTEWLTRYAR